MDTVMLNGVPALERMFRFKDQEFRSYLIVDPHYTGESLGKLRLVPSGVPCEYCHGYGNAYYEEVGCNGKDRNGNDRPGRMMCLTHLYKREPGIFIKLR